MSGRPASHGLSSRDLALMTATCSVCGPDAKIARNGKRGFVCVIGRREAQRRWKKAHPEKARANKKRPPSAHRLTKRDGSPDICKVCGPVAPVPVGRGWGCPNRAKERGFTSFPAEPQPACPICRTYLDRFGSCAKCDDDLSDLDDMWIPVESRRYMAPVAEGFSIQEWPSELLDENESAVPGWKTLGSAEPWRGVKPEYAALFGAGKGKAS